MIEVIRRAVAERQRVPDAPLELVVDGYELTLPVEACERARDRARATGEPHNRARRRFARELLDALAKGLAGRIGRGLLDARDLRALAADLGNEPQVRATLDRLWPHLTPQQLVAGLWTSQERLEAATPWLRAEDRALLRRRPAGRDAAGWWSVADVPLLDEAAELLGEEPPAQRRDRRRRGRERRELEEARAVLADTGLGGGLVDPELVAARYRETDPLATVADRARADRTWHFGHVIVDEAQELPPMAWRMLARRCPSRSMTVVGDLAQTGAVSGVTSWSDALTPHAGGRWRQERLTVNYRTPTEIMAVAGDVLAATAPGVTPPEAVRDGGEAPWSLRLDPDELAAALPAVVAGEAAAVSGGKVAVIVPAARLGELGRTVTAAIPDAAAGAGPATLDAPVAVLPVADAKGLEFDAVVVVDPAAILGASPRGGNDLYVALTRATKRLGVVHGGTLPSVLARLRPRATDDPGGGNKSGSAVVDGP